jgi:hypothetical protein
MAGPTRSLCRVRSEVARGPEPTHLVYRYEDPAAGTRGRVFSKRRPTAGRAVCDAAEQRASRAAAGGRTPRGETKRAVLAALDAGNAMTAGEIAAATGLARAMVSTT